jgi:D-glycero-D-manno-heptose 1,7-bisphosphate phosphatase
MTGRPAHFFDLGGTLLALAHGEIAFDELGRVTLLPGVRNRLSALAGTPVFVVTNQAGIAEGTITLDQFNQWCAQLSAAVPGAVTAYGVCAHARDAGCACRKPRPGLVEALTEAHGIDLANSVLVGDSEIDEQLAAAAGISRFVWAADYFREH